jgi:pectin methylesterase-like acyl-CoA thioesterase
VLRNWLTPAEGALSIAMHYPFPIIGVGAPAAELLPDAVRLFNTELVTPQRYEVANAVGAATTFVSVSKTACVAPRNGELFAIEGLADGREFEELDAAIACAREQLEQDVRELAAKAGLHNAEVEVSTENVTAMNGYGCDVHLRTELTATAKAPAYAVREASPTDPA